MKLKDTYGTPKINKQKIDKRPGTHISQKKNKWWIRMGKDV